MSVRDITVLREQEDGSLKESLLLPYVSMAFFHSNHTPSGSGQTYYMAFPFDLAPTLTAPPRLFKFPENGLIRAALLTVNVGGTFAAGESGPSTVGLFNNLLQTVTNIFTDVKYDAGVRNYVVNNLAITVGKVPDYSIQIVTPVFSTTPTVIRRHCILFYEPLNAL